MRHPGIEPGPPRWQRGIITTRLMTLAFRFHWASPGSHPRGAGAQKTVPRGHHTPYWPTWRRVCGPSTDSGGGFSLLRCRPEAVHPSLCNHEAHACAQTPLLTTVLDRTDPRCTRQTKSAARAPDPRGLSPRTGHRWARRHPTAGTEAVAIMTGESGGTRWHYGALSGIVLKGAASRRAKIDQSRIHEAAPR